MSLETILGELPSLTEAERDFVAHKLDELSVEATRQWLKQWKSRPPLAPGHWTELFGEWTGKSEEDLPEDFSLNHDRYVCGAPKKC